MNSPNITLTSEHTGLSFVDLVPSFTGRGQLYIQAINKNKHVHLSLEGFILNKKGSFDEDEVQEIRDWIYLNEDALKAYWANPSSDELLDTIRKL